MNEKLLKYLEQDPDFSIDNAKRIIGLRNQIIHGYDSISDENIWGILTIHLPKLKSDIASLIERNNC